VRAACFDVHVVLCGTCSLYLEIVEDDGAGGRTDRLTVTSMPLQKAAPEASR
jgi:hypothetical protein